MTDNLEYPYEIAAKIIRYEYNSYDTLMYFISRTRAISDEMLRQKEEIYQLKHQLLITDETIKQYQVHENDNNS